MFQQSETSEALEAEKDESGGKKEQKKGENGKENGDKEEEQTGFQLGQSEFVKGLKAADKNFQGRQIFIIHIHRYLLSKNSIQCTKSKQSFSKVQCI